MTQMLVKRASIKQEPAGPGWCGLVGMSSGKLKGHQFNSRSGHIPGLWVQSLIGVHTRGNWSVSLSHMDISVPPFPLPPSKINKPVPVWGLRKTGTCRVTWRMFCFPLSCMGEVLCLHTLFYPWTDFWSLLLYPSLPNFYSCSVHSHISWDNSRL